MILKLSTVDDEAAASAARERTADLDLERRVRIYLGSRFHPSLNRLRVAAHGGCVTLTGTVHSFYERQLAVSTCKRVAGVMSVVDEIIVADDHQAARRPVLARI